jgi:hypothetical protein
MEQFEDEVVTGNFKYFCLTDKQFYTYDPKRFPPTRGAQDLLFDGVHTDVHASFLWLSFNRAILISGTQLYGLSNAKFEVRRALTHGFWQTPGVPSNFNRSRPQNISIFPENQRNQWKKWNFSSFSAAFFEIRISNFGFDEAFGLFLDRRRIQLPSSFPLRLCGGGQFTLWTTATQTENLQRNVQETERIQKIRKLESVYFFIAGKC